MNYHLPIKPEKSHTKIWIKSYKIDNDTAFENFSKNAGEGKVTLELTFTSNDYSLNKYDVFIEQFLQFLVDKGYMNDFNS